MEQLAACEQEWNNLLGIRRTLLKLRLISQVCNPRTVLQMNSDILCEAIKNNNPRYQDPKRLLYAGQKFFSQNEEDGIIEEIFDRIGTTNKFFVEFGCGNGTENNTLYLLLKGWQGCWIECDDYNVRQAKVNTRSFVKQGSLYVCNAMLTAENADSVFRSLNIPLEPDFLSIDIDGNDYHIFKALKNYRARVVAIEYNAALGPTADAVMKYDPQHRWDLSARFGASLHALEKLAESLGYNLVGCNFNGVNAFFVRSELTQDRFCKPYTSKNHFEPFRYPQVLFISMRRSILEGFELGKSPM